MGPRHCAAQASLGYSVLSLKYASVRRGDPPGRGDFSADPEFVDPDNDDYHLTLDSPCVNAGAYLEGLPFDYDGDRRTGTLLDIGADEYPMEPVFVPLVLRGS